MCRVSLFLFFILPTVFAASCSTETSPNANNSELGSIQSANQDTSAKPPPLVLPLEPIPLPETSPPDSSLPEPALPEAESELSSEISAFPASTFGKYAAKNDTVESTPLPPVEDLTAQMDEYLRKLGTNLEYLKGSRRYAEDALDIVRDTHALAVLALSVGLSEADSPYKKSASAIIAACKNLVSAKTYEEGKAGYETLKRSAAEGAGSLSFSWSDKVAALTPLMKALPNLSVGVKRLTDTENKMNLALERKPQAIYAPLATLAVLSQGCIPNVSETIRPESADKWKECCEEFRDAAIKVNAAAHQYAQLKTGGKKADYSVFKESFQAMTNSCNRCHAEFYPDALTE